MARWQGDARGRLEAAAMELYAERGYESTTVAEIAERAGLTERTFFRHYADKREVLFQGSTALSDLLASTTATAITRDGASPRQAIATAVLATGAFFTAEHKAWSAARQAVIDANPAIRERELIKLATLAELLAATLREHSTTEPAATLLGELGIAVLKTAFLRWLEDDSGASYAEHAREAFATVDGLAPQLSSASMSSSDR